MLKHVDEVYQLIESKLKIPKRVIRWYVTEGLIPQPEHSGRKAYYDLESTKLLERLQVIKLLQNAFRFQLEKIKDILKRYKPEDIEALLSILEILKKDYPVWLKHTLYNGRKQRYFSRLNAVIQNQFFSTLEEKIIDFSKGDFFAFVRNVKSWSLEDFDKYISTNVRYMINYEGAELIKQKFLK